jgi:hypothetical protein
VALFHACLYGSGDGSCGERLFAVQREGPPADIEDEVVLLWVASCGTNFANVLSGTFVGDIRKTNGVFRVHVARWTGEDGIVELSRTQILEMVQTVTTQGKRLKDGRYGTPYFFVPKKR